MWMYSRVGCASVLVFCPRIPSATGSFPLVWPLAERLCGCFRLVELGCGFCWVVSGVPHIYGILYVLFWPLAFANVLVRLALIRRNNICCLKKMK